MDGDTGAQSRRKSIKVDTASPDMTASVATVSSDAQPAELEIFVRASIGEGSDTATKAMELFENVPLRRSTNWSLLRLRPTPRSSTLWMKTVESTCLYTNSAVNTSKQLKLVQSLTRSRSCHMNCERSKKSTRESSGSPFNAMVLIIAALYSLSHFEASQMASRFSHVPGCLY